MKQLSYEDFKIIEKFIYYRVRDLEIACFNNIFLNSGSEDILHALSIYQNRDGGFGHGLEPDNLNPYSSALQTCTALQVIKECGYDDSNLDELAEYTINRALHYIYHYEFKDNVINPCVPSNNQFPHAKWCDYHEDFFKYYAYNPTTNIVAYTLLFKKPNEKYYDKAYETVPTLIKYFLSTSKHDKYQMIGFLELYEVLTKKQLFVDLHTEIFEHLNKLIDKMLAVDPKNWGHEQIASPADLLWYDVFINTPNRHQILENYLDFMIDYRDENGIYKLEWNRNWGNDYPEYEMQKIKWQGIKAIQYLRILKKHNRIELK